MNTGKKARKAIFVAFGFLLAGWIVNQVLPSVYVVEQSRDVGDNALLIAHCLALRDQWDVRTTPGNTQHLQVGDEITWNLLPSLPTEWTVHWLSLDEGFTLQAADGSRVIYTILPDEGIAILALEVSPGVWPWQRLWVRWHAMKYMQAISIALDKHIGACMRRLSSRR